MKKRDMDIIKDLQRFRCLTRNEIIDLHFAGLKNPITSANTVLKRLSRDGYIEVSNNQQPYIYFPSPSSIKKDSAKIPHFLAIAQFYLSLLIFEPPKEFIVEPKYEKGNMEPDAFMIWRKAPFFVEIQRSIYSKKVMDVKFSRYEAYFSSRKWEEECWQPKDRKVFPRVLIITDTKYETSTHSQIRYLQVQNVQQFIDMKREIKSPIRFKIGQGLSVKL